MKVAVLSNTNLDLLLQDLSDQHEVYRPAGHGSWVQDLIDPASPLRGFDPAAVFLLLDGRELIRSCVNRESVLSAIVQAKGHVAGFLESSEGPPVFVASIDVPHEAIKTLKTPRLDTSRKTMDYFLGRAGIDPTTKQAEAAREVGRKVLNPFASDEKVLDAIRRAAASATE